LNGGNIVARFSKLECEHRFANHFNEQTSGLGATRANLLRLLRSVDLVGWSSHEESGRVDRKAFTRFATGSTAVFSKRTHVDAVKSAVSVLVDCSGSMNESNRIQTAEGIVIQLSRILEKSGVSFSVTGFYGRTNAQALQGGGATPINSHALVEQAVFIPFKTWKENLGRASAKLGSISQWARHSTPDYSALSVSIEELSRREESRKILFLITDAEGYDKAHIKHLQELATKLGVKIVAIGIGKTDVPKVFSNGENVERVSDLASASFNKLLKELQ
jgi:cobalamin biosynthesis protein CobT